MSRTLVRRDLATPRPDDRSLPRRRHGGGVQDPIDTAAHVATRLMPQIASAVSLRFGFHMIAAAQRRSVTPGAQAPRRHG
jgi:hypothetical protein